MFKAKQILKADVQSKVYKYGNTKNKCCVTFHMIINSWNSVGWLIVFNVPSTAGSFTVPCEGREARFLPRSHQESNPGSLCGSPLHNRCTTPAPQ